MGVEVVIEVERKASVIWVISVQIWPLTWKVYAKCKLGVTVLKEVCGNKLLMCFLFVAGRSYQDAWHKLFGLFRNLATIHLLPAVKSLLSTLSLSVMVLVVLISFSVSISNYILMFVAITSPLTYTHG